MRVAVALSQLPLPEGGAPGRCGVALLQGLAAHGLEVDAVAADRAAEQATQPAADPAAGRRSPAAAVGAQVVATAETLGRARLYAAKLARPRGELGRGRFEAAFADVVSRADVVHLEETDTGWSGLGGRAPRVLRVHYLAQLDLPVVGLWSGDPLRRAEEVVAELRLARRHHHLVASTPEVAARLRRLSPRSAVSVAPLSVDPAAYPTADLTGEPLAGLIGTASWPPTRSALRRLASRVWPLVRTSAPTARLQLAGRGIHQQAGLAGVPGVEVVGEVASASDFLRSLSVLVYPVERGSGMKVKVLEALASGVPVVTTPQGAEGIGATDGVVVRTDDRGVAAAVVELLTDPLARAQRGAAALDHFRRVLAPGPAAAPLVEVYRRALGG